MSRLLFLCGALALLAGCSGQKGLGDPCFTDAGANVGGQGDCTNGLVCQHADTCSGGCSGKCRQLCHTDDECTGGAGTCKCGETLSTANGGHLVCDGTGC